MISEGSEFITFPQRLQQGAVKNPASAYFFILFDAIEILRHRPKSFLSGEEINDSVVSERLICFSITIQNSNFVITNLLVQINMLIQINTLIRILFAIKFLVIFLAIFANIKHNMY